MTVGLALAAGALLGEYLAQALRRTKSPLDRRLTGLLQARNTRRREREPHPGGPGAVVGRRPRREQQ